MKRLLRVVFSLSLFFAFAAYGQTSVPPFKHIVIIVQENRTPDNIFGGGAPGGICGTQDDFELGVDIQNGGLNKWSSTGSSCLTKNSGLLNGGSDHCHNCKDTYHPNAEYAGWVPQCDYDATAQKCKMDGASHSWECNPKGCNFPEYQYVDKPAVQPYFDIATNYGFANYMFMTHQGPSFEAHQFIFGGTSAPAWPGNQYYDWFGAENPSSPLADPVGCPATSGWPLWVDPDGNEYTSNTYTCYDRNTLVTYQDSSGTVHDWTAGWSSTPQPAWKYYMPTDNNDDNAAIWNGPEDDPQTCYFKPSGGGTACNSSEYTTHVSVASNATMGSAPVLTDIANCQLPAISWVIPDERWSDHPGPFAQGLGPDWVAVIVDAIGESSSNSNHVCDYWGTDSTAQHIEPTAIFITWDDWGAFYDHVPPPAVYFGDPNTDKCTTQNAPNGWGCGYVYGFRVPLLVVSEWTKPATISGACGGTQYPPCPNFGQNDEYVHDFGSILAFTENNFTQQGLNLPPIAPTGYTYADQNSLDRTYNSHPAVPLWDFFTASQPRGFTKINPIYTGDTASSFENYYQNNNVSPIGPEAGDPMD